MIKFRCEACNKKIGAPDDAAGKRVVCPGCEQAVRVPETSVLTDESPSSASSDAVGHATVSATDVGSAGRRMAGSVAGLIVAAIVAGIFSLLWVGIAVFTGYEFGIAAWILGALVGLVAGAITKNPSPIFGALAALLALGSVLGAKLILATFIFLTALGLEFLDEFANYSPEKEKLHHAVMEEMIDEGAFDGELRGIAQSSVATYFEPDGDHDAQLDLFDNDWQQHLEDSQRVREMVDARIESMSEADRDAAVARARERHPYWIEDHSLYLAVLDALVEHELLPAHLERHARMELAVLDGGSSYDHDYHQATSPREQQQRRRELRERVGGRIARMTDDQRQAALQAARERHPHWIADERLHYAVLVQVVEAGELSGDVLDVARADISLHMEHRWDQPALDGRSQRELTELRNQATAVVNARIGELSAQQRADAIAAAEQAYPNWADPLGFDADEMRHLLLQEGVDGTFSSALRASFSIFDILWIILAVSSAYTVAVKQGTST